MLQWSNLLASACSAVLLKIFLNQQIHPQHDEDNKNREEQRGSLAWVRDIGDLICVPIFLISFWLTIMVRKEKDFLTFPDNTFVTSTYLVYSSHWNKLNIHTAVMVVSKHLCSCWPCSAAGMRVTPEEALLRVAQQFLMALVGGTPRQHGICAAQLKSGEAVGYGTAWHGTACLPNPHFKFCAKVLMKWWHKHVVMV